MTSEQGKGVSAVRIHGFYTMNIGHLECPICQDLLWKPVACQTCEKPFCSACIGQWLIKHPNNCPNRCLNYVERKCPPLYTTLLAELQISCFYKSEGCPQILSYEALDKHEIDCGFQPKRCSGCRSEIPKKDLINHENLCGSIQLSCHDCKLVYKRQDAAVKHTENMCLKEQLRQLRLTNVPKVKRTINFSDLPSAADQEKAIPIIYHEMRWTELFYAHRERMTSKYSKSGYTSAFIPNGSSHVAYFKDQGSLSAQSTNHTFTLVSITACAAWKDGLELTITGHRQSLQTDAHTVILLFGKLKMILLQWENIDKVIFKSSGGNIHPVSGGLESSSQVVLTQLTLS